MPEVDLFDAIKHTYRGRRLEGNPPSDWVLHRFLASDKDYACFAKEINLTVRDRRMVWEFWRAAFALQGGRRTNPPFFKYAAPKRSKKVSVLTNGIMEHFGHSRQKAEEIAVLVELAGKTDEMFDFLGVPEGERK